jgi:hypothetical protein
MAAEELLASYQNVASPPAAIDSMSSLPDTSLCGYRQRLRTLHAAPIGRRRGQSGNRHDTSSSTKKNKNRVNAQNCGRSAWLVFCGVLAITVVRFLDGVICRPALSLATMAHSFFWRDPR